MSPRHDFDLQPTLEGELLRLRPLREEDWPALFAVASDPLIWEQHPQPTRYQEEVFREYFRGAMECGGAFAVIDRKTGRVIGSSRFIDYDEKRSEIEIGYTFLARAYWGGAFNREMKDLLLRHAFRYVRHVVFLVGPDNLRSQKAMEKIGGVRMEPRVKLGRLNVVYQIDAPAPMKIAVIGAGAVGGYFGGRLADAGNDVTFVVRGETLKKLRAGPLRVKSIKGDFEVQVRATDNPVEIGSVEAVLVAVKGWQVPEAAAAIERMTDHNSLIVPLQNGMEAPGQLAAVLGAGRIAGGLCRIVATAVGPGEIDHFWAEPSIAFGKLESLARPERLELLRDAFTAAGVRCDVPRNIARAMWEKFLFITPWGSIGAVTGLPVGPICSNPESRARLVEALEEVTAIARAEGIDLGAESVANTLSILEGLPEEITSSMQRDIIARRPSELEAQTGAVARMGRKTGVPTPVHDAIYAELLPLEQRARWSRDR